MLYPQGNFHSQGVFSPQAFQGNPFQGNPQGSFYPQATLGPQGPFGAQGGFGPQIFQGNPGSIPFANTLYGYPQQTPAVAQGLPQWSNWQHPVQQQAALQQQAIQQLLAHQLAAQQLAAQQQPNPEQINPALTPRHHLLQQLAQYHYLVAQQLAQLAAHQAVQSSVNPYAGQFIPGQLGANFVPGQPGANYLSGSTMH